jgi:hypothetical protein
MLQTKEFIQAVSDSGHEFNVKKLISGGLDDSSTLEGSYDQMCDVLQESELESIISDALFFWPLKDTLFNVAVNIAQTENNE